MKVHQHLQDGWSKIEFHEIASLSKKKFDPKRENVEKACIELEHIEKGTGRLLGQISSAGQLSTKNVFRAGDVLFGKLRPNLRKYIYCGFEGVCSSEIWVFNTHKRTDSRFLFYLIQQEKFIQSTCITSGSKMPRADWGIVSEVPFPLPPMSEQKAIADLLSTWDEAIEKSERLIQAKEKQLQGLVQKYISKPQLGKKSEGWEPVKLGDIFQVQKNKGRKGVPVFSVTLYDGIVERSEIERKMETNLAPEEHLLMEPGDLAYNMMRMWQGASGLAKSEGVISPAYVVVRPKPPVDPEFAAYWFKSPRMIYLFWAYSYGITGDRLRLYPFDFSLIKCSIPPISTQKKIVQILDNVQREIDLLKQLAEKYKTQKRGLMQKMLTGEWRVKPEIVNQYMEA